MSSTIKPLQKYTYYLASIWKLLTGVKPMLGVIRAFLKPSAPAGQTEGHHDKPPEHLEIELRKSKLRFKTRSAMDIWSIKETFLDRFYERYGVPISEGWTVIDIGGGLGDFTIFVAAQHPKNTVYAFEPTPDSFALLQENLRLNHIENARAFPEAVWAVSGPILIDTSPREPVQFTSRSGDELSRGRTAIQNRIGPGIEVPGISLAEALEHTGVAQCNLLKMDCEGAEYNILFHAPDEILERIERIVMEYHDNTSMYTHEDMARFLAEKGFAVKTYPNQVHAYLGYLYASR